MSFSCQLPSDARGVCFVRGAALPPGAEEEIPRCEQIPLSWWMGGLVASTALCTAILSPMFDLPVSAQQLCFASSLLIVQYILPPPSLWHEHVACNQGACHFCRCGSR